MAAPRPILPGSSYLITRRCFLRTFRLRPSQHTNRILLFCLANAARQAGILIHAVCVMSDHYHAVVTDTDGTLPNFLREMHRNCAKALNVSQKQRENLWSVVPTSVVRLGTLEDILAAMAYVATNPVKAALVPEPSQWPGVNLWEKQELLVPRPHDYFAQHGSYPDFETLRIESPALNTLSPQQWSERLAEAVRTHRDAAHRAVHARRSHFLGAAAVCSVSFLDRAHSDEATRNHVPTVKAADPAVRKALLDQERAFRAQYAASIKPWREGVRNVVFPAGTWWMRVFHRVNVAPFDSAR